MVVKIVELIGVSDSTFEDAVATAVERASVTIQNITGLDVIGQSAQVKDGKITEYRVNVKIAFVVNDGQPQT